MSASDGERSPKRQRLESYSPASPPLSETTATIARRTPHTPPPSVRMSPSWQAPNPTSQPSQNQPSGAVNAAFPTPPSTAGFQSQMTGRSASSDMGEDSGQASPATENDAEVRKDGDGDEKMMEDRQHKPELDGANFDAEHRRTDHERQEDNGGHAVSSMSASALSKISTTPIAPAQPHLSQNLLELYDLQRIQASVARRDPVTGEKINKLRKSYEGKVKALGLEGRNKAQTNQKELEGLVDSGWDQMTPDGTTWWQAHHQDSLLSSAAAEKDIFAKLDSALKMEPGRLPGREHEQWKNLLGLDDSTTAALSSTKAPPVPVTSIPTAAANSLPKTAPGAVVQSSAPVSPRGITGRPERTGKKRRYDESTYAGYQEGFEDDGYSTSGMDDTGRRGSAAVKRQKRKDFPSSANSPPFSTSANSNGNMVGVRSS